MSTANDTAREQFNIYIHVDDEDELYNSFDRRKMLISDDLVSFVTTICDAKPDHMGIRLIISGAKINQKRLRSAIDLQEKRFYDRLRSIEIVSEGVEEDDAH